MFFIVSSSFFTVGQKWSHFKDTGAKKILIQNVRNIFEMASPKLFFPKDDLSKKDFAELEIK